MTQSFPDPIKKLPQVDIDLPGVCAHLLQGENHQVIFMEFQKKVELPTHHHESQWEIVLNGHVDLKIHGKSHRYIKGDTFFIPKGVPHGATVYEGYTAIVFFNQRDRYQQKK